MTAPSGRPLDRPLRRSRSARRLGLAAAALALAIAAPAAAAQAQVRHAAPAAAAPGPQPRFGDPQSAMGRVGDFYGAYIDAVWDRGSGRLAADLRAEYLTPALRKRLAAWESAQHADGVLRAQDVPQGWRVGYDGSGAGHASSTVRLQWGNPAHPTYTYLAVQSDLATKKISDIRPK